MTEATLGSRVKLWQRRLAPLGLSHWKFTVSIEDAPTGGHNDRDAAATSETSNFYDVVAFEFRQDVLNNEDLDVFIVHEWLHVAFRDYDSAVYSVQTLLGAPTFMMWEDRVDHEQEGVIDRLARLIVALHE